MIATGLVFLLGALVATLLMLLFVPILWRNAQRLARRDDAATMPATMNEIRAEIDHVRAQAAVTVRRQEMVAQKARERAALERAAVGRLTHSHADIKLRGDQHRDDANALRTTLAQTQERLDGLEEAKLALEEDNRGLREQIADLEASAAALNLELQDAVRSAGERPELSPEPGATETDRQEESEPARVAAATAALLALAKAHRGTPEAPGGTILSPAPRAETPVAPAPSFAAESVVVEELSALAAAPRPENADERERQNGRVRERIAEVAARIIQMTSPDAVRSLPVANGASASPDLAERVRRLTGPKASALPNPEPEPDPAPELEPETRPAIAASAQPASQTSAKRRRRGARSRPRPSS